MAENFSIVRLGFGPSVTCNAHVVCVSSVVAAPALFMDSRASDRYLLNREQNDEESFRNPGKVSGSTGDDLIIHAD